MYTNGLNGTRQGDYINTTVHTLSLYSVHMCSSKYHANRGKWEASCAYIVLGESLVWHHLASSRCYWPRGIISPLMASYAILGGCRFMSFSPLTYGENIRANMLLMNELLEYSYVVYYCLLATPSGGNRISSQLVSQVCRYY